MDDSKVIALAYDIIKSVSIEISKLIKTYKSSVVVIHDEDTPLRAQMQFQWEQENKIYGINKEITTWELTQAIALGYKKYLQDSLTDSFVDAIQAKYSEAS